MNPERLNCLYSTNMFGRIILTKPEQNLWQTMQSWCENTHAYSGDTVKHLVKRKYLVLSDKNRKAEITVKGQRKLKEYRQVFQI